MSAEKIFIVLSCYSMLRHYMAIGIPVGITQIVDAIAAADRIREFLCEPSLNVNRTVTGENPHVKINNVVVALNDKKNIFDGLNLNLNETELVGITGPIGSGKTCLIKTILQDLQIVSGDVHVIFFFCNYLIRNLKMINIV